MTAPSVDLYQNIDPARNQLQHYQQSRQPLVATDAYTNANAILHPLVVQPTMPATGQLGGR